ncbi:MAG TPA: FtsQ-type POTRA domain-containing protein [Verrucomicrobiae bacterium]|nr:FtsQ-type POTRA domain-containing protein [Verrucomicrobiae bacterium]
MSRRHVLDVKLRSDQVRASRVRLAIMAISVPAFTIFGLYLLWRTGEWALDRFVYENPDFAIQRVDVQTDGVIPSDELRRWSGVKKGANLFALDLASVKRNLELWPVIGSVSVERILPRTLKIRVTERKPIAQVNMPHATRSGGIAYYVFQLDATGMVMQPLDPRRYVVPISQMTTGPLPVITGLNDSQLQLGRRVKLPEALAALRLIAAFDRSPMAGLVTLRSLDVSDPGVVVATTARGGEITFGLDDPDQQVRRWHEVYDLGRRYNKVIATADFAVTNNVPVRWTESIAPPAVAPANSTTLTPLLRRKNV